MPKKSRKKLTNITKSRNSKNMLKNETLEARAQRLEKQRQCMKKLRNEEDPNQKRERLDANKSYNKNFRNESEEDRNLRLAKKKSYDHKRRHEETEEERQIRLDSKKSYDHKRRDEETEEERQIRLDSKKTYQNKKRDEETEEQYKNRLESLRIHASNVRASENFDKKHNRLHEDDFTHSRKEKEIDPQNNASLDQEANLGGNFQKVSLDKMKDFHKMISSIEFQLCQICNEKWPDMRINKKGVCLRCSRDKATTKMNPGEVPPELKVSWKPIF